MFGSFSKWAWSRPTYKSENWDKLDAFIDVESETLNKLGEGVDKAINFINPPATKWQQENKYICSKNWDK